MLSDEAFWARVDRSVPGGCWPWMGACNAEGYGRVYLGRVDGKRRSANASRFALELKLGRRLRGGELARHTCGYAACCNPGHLFAGGAGDVPAVRARRW